VEKEKERAREREKEPERERETWAGLEMKDAPSNIFDCKNAP